METLFLTEQEAGLRDVLQNKVNKTLESKAKNIEHVLQKVQNDNTLLNDNLVPARYLQFEVDDKITLSFEDQKLDISDFSLGQIADKFDIPRTFLRNLVNGKTWQKRLATEILGKTAEFGERERVLIREVDGKVRAFLTDSYRRYDSMQIYMSFYRQ